MKKYSFLPALAMVALFLGYTNKAFSQANVTLSNLTSPTSINQSLLPSTDNSKDLGSSSLRWKSGYFKNTLFLGGSSSTIGIQMNPNSTGKTLDVRFLEAGANGTNYVGFRAPTSIASNKVWVLPAADGTNGQVLTTNGSGTLSWSTAGSGGGVGTNTTHYIPKWDGSALVTGSLKDSSGRISLGSIISSEGRLTVYRNSGIGNGSGESAIQGIGYNSFAGETYSKGFLGALNLNGLSGVITQPFGFEEAGVFGYHTGTSYGGGVVGYSKGTSGANYGVYGLSDCAGFIDFSAVNYGVYGKAMNATFNYALRGEGKSTAGTTAYGLYASASGDGGNFAAYFANGKVYVQDWIDVSDSVHVNDALVVGTDDRPSAYEFAVTGGADGYIDDVLSVHTTTATAQLNVKGTNETVLIEGTTPYIKLIDGNNPGSFVQASGDDLRIGTLSGNTNGKLIFRINGSNKNAMDASGKFGIGTTSPSALLHLKGSNELLRLDGTDAFIAFNSGNTQKAFIWRTGNDLKIVSNSGDIFLGNNVTGDQVMILSDGRVGIGTFTPKTGYKLSVEGKVACRELKVETAAWPDYVFNDEFELMPLNEVENFIAKNNHLPGVPAAAEVVGDGIEVGAMQVKMMQKIEELTLYVIDLQKQNDELKQLVAQLAKQ